MTRPANIEPHIWKCMIPEHKALYEKENSHHSPVPAAVVKQGSAHEGRAKNPVQQTRSQFVLTFFSHRKRFLDYDNLCSKFVTDGIISAGILPDDRADIITAFIHRQIKCVKGQEEETIIEIVEI